MSIIKKRIKSIGFMYLSMPDIKALMLGNACLHWGFMNGRKYRFCLMVKGKQLFDVALPRFVRPGRIDNAVFSLKRWYLRNLTRHPVYYSWSARDCDHTVGWGIGECRNERAFQAWEDGFNSDCEGPQGYTRLTKEEYESSRYDDSNYGTYDEAAERAGY